MKEPERWPRWNRTVTEFPGDHTGYWSHPDEFAAALLDALAR